MQGTIDLVKKGFFPKGSKVLYAHLGGAPALNGYGYAFRNGLPPMAALPLCDLPPGTREARSWILGQVALLASRAEADLKFAGSEQGQPGEPPREMLAIE